MKTTKSRATAVEYTMIVEPAHDKRGEYYGGYFPDLPGCTTMGDTLGELRRNAKEAVALYLEGLRETGQPIPKASSKLIRIKVPA